MAVAHDLTTVSSVVNTVLSLTFSHTCTGANLVLDGASCAEDATASDRIVSTYTYALSSLTKIAEVVANTGGTATGWKGYLLNPATGANNAVVTWSGIVDAGAGVVTSLTGVAQNAPEASHSAVGDGAGPITDSVTTVNANAWVVDFSFLRGNKALTSGGSQVQRGALASASNISFCVSTLPVASPGATSMSSTWVSNNRDWGIILASYAPAGAAAANPSPDASFVFCTS